MAKILETFLQMVMSLESKLDNAPLTSLIESFRVIFEPVGSVIGQKLKDVLEALASLRNVFAHGRDFYLEFDDIFDPNGAADLDDNPFQKAALRLYHAGILKSPAQRE